jgi:hypothetical protein
MIMIRGRHARATLAVALLIGMGALLVAGCDNPFKPRIGYVKVEAEPPPKPNSPRNLMKLFQWCWVNQEATEYEDLFTEDFRFVFTDVEAVENEPITRDQEIEIAKRIFLNGSASEPRARRIEFTFVSEPTPIDDTRPNKPAPWHKLIQTRVILRVELSDPTPISIDGNLNFFVVRGDSAALTPDMKARFLDEDLSKRWFIERWEDKTDVGPGVAALLTLAMQGEIPATVSEERPRGATRTAVAAGDPRWTWGDLMLLFR